MAAAVVAALLFGALGPRYALREAVVLTSPEGDGAGRSRPQLLVLVGRSKSGARTGGAEHFVVAGVARLRIEDLGSTPRGPRQFTLVSGEGPSCVATETRRVLVSVERDGRLQPLAEGAVVGGCAVPEKRASLWALEGAHPNAVFVDGVSIRRDEIGRAEAAANSGSGGDDRFEVESALRVGGDTIYVLSRFELSDVLVVVTSGQAMRRLPSPVLLKAASPPDAD